MNRKIFGVSKKLSGAPLLSSGAPGSDLIPKWLSTYSIMPCSFIFCSISCADMILRSPITIVPFFSASLNILQSFVRRIPPPTAMPLSFLRTVRIDVLFQALSPLCRVLSALSFSSSDWSRLHLHNILKSSYSLLPFLFLPFRQIISLPHVLLLILYTLHNLL